MKLSNLSYIAILVADPIWKLLRIRGTIEVMWLEAVWERTMLEIWMYIALGFAVSSVAYSVYAARRAGSSFQHVASSFWLGVGLVGMIAPQLFLDGWLGVALGIGLLTPALVLSVRSLKKTVARLGPKAALPPSHGDLKPAQELLRRVDAEDDEERRRRGRRRGLIPALGLGGVLVAMGAVYGSVFLMVVGLGVGLVNVLISRYIWPVSDPPDQTTLTDGEAGSLDLPRPGAVGDG